MSQPTPPPGTGPRSRPPRQFPVVAALLWRHLAGLFQPASTGTPFGLVFSKDRALQLDALLRSWKRHGRHAPALTVLWHATDERHARAYREVFARNAGVLRKTISEKAFRTELIAALQTAEESRVFFLVDDLMLVRPFDFQDLEGVNPLRTVASLRLGPEITHCQTHSFDSPPPVLKPVLGGKWLSFDWNEATGDWAMPLSVDGNIFDRKEMLAILGRTAFKAPNSLEHALGPYRFAFRFRKGLCPPESALCNLPINQVQNEGYQFPHAGLSAEVLLQAWEDGFEISLEDVERMERHGCHVAVVPKLVPRAR